MCGVGGRGVGGGRGGSGGGSERGGRVGGGRGRSEGEEGGGGGGEKERLLNQNPKLDFCVASTITFFPHTGHTLE